MNVLLMRIAAPMQSWGTRSRFLVRDTEREPSKSGILGIIAACLGQKRNEPLDNLTALRMGVRVNKEGHILKDFHTAGGGKIPGEKKYGVIKSDNSSADTVVSRRYYLSDADFLVGLEGDRDFLKRIYSAIMSPKFPIFLGRKSFVPSIPILISEERGGIVSDSLESALRKHPFPKYIYKNDHLIPDRIRLIFETKYGEGEETRMDNPESFEISDRKYCVRYITTKWIEKSALKYEEGEGIK